MAAEQERAEAMVEQAERWVERVAAQAGGFLARALARTREEIEDIWAEAQSAHRARE